MNIPNKNELTRIYGEAEKSAARFQAVADHFAEIYHHDIAEFFTAPGRTEIIGNHTDHNGGRVIAGSIDMDTIGAAYPNNSSVIRITSEGYDKEVVVDINDLASVPKAQGTVSLVAGMVEAIQKFGFKVAGFDAYVTTNVIRAAGVSSSASFEMLVCSIINYFFNDGAMTYINYAKAGQYAENKYWLKGSGLLDQLACAVGGMITIDFADIENPAIREIKCDFDEMGHDLVIINTGKGHADLSAEYSAVPNEMKKVAEYFGKEVLEQCKEDDVIENVKAIREFAGDRAVLRAFHFFEENKRVDAEVEALEKKDFATFFNKITESGDSSWKWLQNCYCNETPDEQSITVALALTKLYLDKIGRGVCRVHGGGFAGVIAAFLPKEETEGFTKYIDKALGEGSAYVMHIRPQGAVKVEF
jgi:galactokinase